MSNDNKGYPDWLDQELFASLPADEPAAEALPEAREASPAVEKKQPSAPEKESAPKKKKAKKPAAEKPEPRKAAKAEPANGKKNKEKKETRAKAPAPPENGGGEKPKKGGGALRGFLIAMIVIVSLALIVSVAAVAGAYVVTNSDTNLPNVYLDEVYVGGLTEDETVRALEAAGWEEKRGGTLTISLPEGVSVELDFLRAGACEPKEEAAASAFRYGHDQFDWFGNLFTYVRGLTGAVNLSRQEFTIDRDYVAAAVDEAVEEFEALTAGAPYRIDEENSTIEVVKGIGEMSLDRGAICDKACEQLLSGSHEMQWDEMTGEPTMPDFESIAVDLKKDVANAYYDPEKDEIVPEVLGAELDTAMAEKLWKDAEVLETVSIPITIIEPEITEAGLKEVLFHDKLGDCMTYIIGSTANRISNIRVACSRFDGYVLQPGETFSYNEVVGERTAEAGFKYAPAYEGTEHVDQLGGGICQVSSTLYNAVLYANLEINERSCHNMEVAYLPLGLDATVSWGGPEFVFTNTRDYPIKLKAWVDDRGRELTIEVWGTDVDGSEVDLITGSWPAVDTAFRDEYGVSVQIGSGAWMERHIHYPDGTEVVEERVYSYYKLPDDQIHYPVIETEEEEPEAAAAETAPPAEG